MVQMKPSAQSKFAFFRLSNDQATAVSLPFVRFSCCSENQYVPTEATSVQLHEGTQTPLRIQHTWLSVVFNWHRSFRLSHTHRQCFVDLTDLRWHYLSVDCTFFVRTTCSGRFTPSCVFTCSTVGGDKVHGQCLHGPWQVIRSSHASRLATSRWTEARHLIQPSRAFYAVQLLKLCVETWNGASKHL